jgi:hypothetical protein
MEGFEDFEEEEPSHVRPVEAAEVEEAHETDRRFNEVLAVLRHSFRTGKRISLYNVLARAYDPVKGEEDPPLLR